MDVDRLSRAVPLVLAASRPVLKAVLAQALSETHSENEWDVICDRVDAGLKDHLSTSFALANLMAECDIRDPQGRLNADAIIKAFESEIPNRPPKQAAQLKHLVAYLRQVCAATKLTRRSFHEQADE
jgi:hypothetical protein